MLLRKTKPVDVTLQRFFGFLLGLLVSLTGSLAFGRVPQVQPTKRKKPFPLAERHTQERRNIARRRKRDRRHKQYQHQGRRRKRSKRYTHYNRRNCYQRWLGKRGRSFLSVNVNTASVKKIQTLPCIGRKRAIAIVSMRMSYGAFKKKEELRRVAGIGRKIMGWIRPHIRIKVNINRASLAELEALKPLSGGLGEAIYKYRKRKGPFRRLHDLMHVRGIGRGTFERIKFFLTLRSPKRQMVLLLRPKKRRTRRKKQFVRERPLPRSQDYIPERRRPKPPPARRNKIIKID